MSKDPNEYLQKGMYGAKKTLIDERRHYLGSLRERVYLTISPKQLQNDYFLKAFEKEIKQHPNGKLLLNGKYDLSDFEMFIQVAQKNKLAFTLVSNEYSETSPAALIYTATDAVNEPTIDVAEKYPVEKETEKTEKKPSLFKRFFS